MSLILYSEINGLCILILFLVWIKVRTGIDMQNNQRWLMRVLVSNMAFFLLDWAWVLIDGKTFAMSGFFNYLVNGLYYIMSGVAGFCWFVYSENIQQSRLVSGKRNLAICFLPVLALIGLTIASYWTGELFYIDENNTYHRGDLYVFQVLIAFSYMGFTACKALVLALRKENYVSRSKYLTLASFVVMPFVFGTAQALLGGIPLLCLGITLGVLHFYFNFQEQLISLDPLTQLNNRNQLIKYLSSKMAHRDKSKALYLLIMDIDFFKKINDHFGHIEGDRALVRVAEALKLACANEPCFISRYGGDEFVLILEVQNSEELEVLCGKINDALACGNARTNAPYPLMLSIGYARYEDSIQSIPQLIALADEELYRVKRERKNQKAS